MAAANQQIFTLSVQEPGSSSSAQAQIYHYGAHVTSWSDTINGAIQEYFFLSKTAILDGSKPIRGGIPICWPQFSIYGPLSQHGFARNKVWAVTKQLSDSSDQVNRSTVVFALDSSSVPEWTNSFRVEYEVVLSWSRGDPSSTLSCRLTCHNLDAALRPFAFTSALHAYFAVSDISHAVVANAAGVSYIDQLQKDESGRSKLFVTAVDQPDIRFEAETDRIYHDAFTPERQNAMFIRDSGAQRTFKILSHGFPDAVVWNAWERKAATMADMEQGGWHRYVCVEPAIIQRPIQLNAQSSSHSASITLSVHPLPAAAL